MPWCASDSCLGPTHCGIQLSTLMTGGQVGSQGSHNVNCPNCVSRPLPSTAAQQPHEHSGLDVYSGLQDTSRVGARTCVRFDSRDSQSKTNSHDTTSAAQKEGRDRDRDRGREKEREKGRARTRENKKDEKLKRKDKREKGKREKRTEKRKTMKFR